MDADQIPCSMPNMSLARLRESKGMKQADMKKFSQTSISKLEKRKDIKLSTLIQYLDGMGLGLELRVYDKGAKENTETRLILRV